MPAESGPAELSASLREVKKAAYAWRQTVFFVSQLEPEAARRVVEAMHHVHSRPTSTEHSGRSVPPATNAVLAWLVSELDDALDGRAPAQPFLGWTVGPHPALTMH